ncbi:MAG: TRAP transporter small permease [Lawsonibacter sp.]|nr:TRAP transporter small permease [Lawsonibacter sp.]
MKKVLKAFDAHFERVCMGILFVMMFIVVLLGILTRTMGSPLSWTEEASRLTFVWMIFFGLSFGTKYDKHIRVTILVDKFGPKFSAGVTLFWDMIAIVVFILIGFYGFQYVGYSASSLTYALQLNKGLVAFVIPLSACLNVFRTIQKMVKEHIPNFTSIGSNQGGV